MSIPEVATTDSDGYAVLHPGTRRWSVPVLLTAQGDGRVAWLEVNGVGCPFAQLPPGTVVRLTCTALVKPHSTVTVRLRTSDAVIATWSHAVR